MPVQHVPGREAAVRQLASFVPSAGRVYTSTRNFDYGPDNRNNVSILSPYLRHRLLLEQEVLEAVLAEHTFDAAEKFIQELFWRAYFKGWLERRPQVWSAYRQGLDTQLDRLEHDADLRVNYDRATRGNTGIDCFDAWTEELLETGIEHTCEFTTRSIQDIKYWIQWYTCFLKNESEKYRPFIICKLAYKPHELVQHNHSP